MKIKKLLIILISVVLIGVTGALILYMRSDDRIYTRCTINLLESLKAGDFKAATNDFNAFEARQMSSDDVDKCWNTLVFKLGPLQDYRIASIEKGDPWRGITKRVCVLCNFSRDTVFMYIEFDLEKKIGGFSLSQ